VVYYTREGTKTALVRDEKKYRS